MGTNHEGWTSLSSIPEPSNRLVMRCAVRLAEMAQSHVARLADRLMVAKRDQLNSVHIVTSAYVVYENEVLLIHHRGLNRWLAPGGHMNFAETPEACAIREVREETG